MVGSRYFGLWPKMGRTNYIGTSRLDLTELEVKTYFERRWSIEVVHRELKQTCGFGRCQANIGRAGRNHIGLSILALVRKQRRRRLEYTTLYQQGLDILNLTLNTL